MSQIVIKPHNVLAYSKCPKKSFFSWGDSNSLSFDSQIVRNVIQASFIRHANKERPYPWKSIPRLIDKQMRLLIKIPADEARYRRSKNILNRLYNWYFEIYTKKYFFPGLINVPIVKPESYTFTYYDTVEIVGIDNSVPLFDFTEDPDGFGPVKLFNDLSVHTRIAKFYEATKILPNKYVRINITANTIHATEIQIKESLIKNPTKIVNQLIENITKNIFYPSFSELCYNCPYREHCSL